MLMLNTITEDGFGPGHWRVCWPRKLVRKIAECELCMYANFHGLIRKIVDFVWGVQVWLHTYSISSKDLLLIFVNLSYLATYIVP